MVERAELTDEERSQSRPERFPAGRRTDQRLGEDVTFRGLDRRARSLRGPHERSSIGRTSRGAERAVEHLLGEDLE